MYAFSSMLIWNLVYVPDLFCRPISPVESTQESLWLINGTSIWEIRATWHISSNIVETREIDLFWDMSITNNVKSCKNQWILIDKWHIGERATWHMNEYPSKVNNCTIIQLHNYTITQLYNYKDCHCRWYCLSCDQLLFLIWITSAGYMLDDWLNATLPREGMYWVEHTMYIPGGPNNWKIAHSPYKLS